MYLVEFGLLLAKQRLVWFGETRSLVRLRPNTVCFRRQLALAKTLIQHGYVFEWVSEHVKRTIIPVQKHGLDRTWSSNVPNIRPQRMDRTTWTRIMTSKTEVIYGDEDQLEQPASCEAAALCCHGHTDGFKLPELLLFHALVIIISQNTSPQRTSILCVLLQNKSFIMLKHAQTTDPAWVC